MKVTVEFEVEPHDTLPNRGVYVIDGVATAGGISVTRKIITAYEAQKPQTFEKDGYTIRRDGDWWGVDNEDGGFLVSAPSAEYAWSEAQTYATWAYLHEYVKPMAVLAEFLEERGL